MNQSEELHGAPRFLPIGSKGEEGRGLRRLNRLPLLGVFLAVLIVLATIVLGLSSRGSWRNVNEGDGPGEPRPASSFAENLKRGVGDGIIGEPQPGPPPRPAPEVAREPLLVAQPQPQAPQALPALPLREEKRSTIEDEEIWRARLARDHEEQLLNERHRQMMARLQRAEGARASPLRIDTAGLEAISADAAKAAPGSGRSETDGGGALDPVAMLRNQLVSAGLSQGNQQLDKEAFLFAEGTEPGRLVDLRSPKTLMRGSMIPAILLTGINSDLPGRMLAQVSRPVYDTATGTHLLIPAGARLLGRYDSKVSYGQSRVLVIWTDIVMPDGRSLDIGAMAGIDAKGEAGFGDKVNRHLLRTFGSAALIAMIGTGLDLALPETPAFGTGPDASDAARRSFSETFGRLAERTISKNLDVQPSLAIRPGYRFNILVDQDLVFE